MPKQKHTRESDQKILKMKPHPETPLPALEVINKMKEEAQARMDLRKLECQALGVEVAYRVAEYQHDLATGKKQPMLPNGDIDPREGVQYLFENSSNTKNSIASMAMLTTGSDPTQNNVNIAILSRVKGDPVSVDATDAELTVERVIEG